MILYKYSEFIWLSRPRRATSHASSSFTVLLMNILPTRDHHKQTPRSCPITAQQWSIRLLMQGGREGSAKGYFQSGNPRGEKQRYIYLQHTRKRFLHQRVVSMEQLLRAVGMAMSPWSSRSVWTLLSDIIWILGGLVLRQFGLDPFGFFPNRDILWFFEKEGSNIPLLANGTPTTHAND